MYNFKLDFNWVNPVNEEQSTINLHSSCLPETS